jgi:carbonic anhydrase/acetyltransferase-like protein (isoleucine patch superfamily)
MRIALGEHEPNVDDSAWIAPNATVIGRTTLGAEVGVWYGTVIRANVEAITVGARTNIQDGCVLHADPGFPLTIGSGVSVGHNATLHGCTIEDNVLIGMGATVLNGARIGTGSLVAANALIPEGAVIPPRSLVAGVPGKVRRELDEAAVERLELSSAVYVELLSRHRDAVAL